MCPLVHYTVSVIITRHTSDNNRVLDASPTALSGESVAAGVPVAVGVLEAVGVGVGLVLLLLLLVGCTSSIAAASVLELYPFSINTWKAGPNASRKAVLLLANSVTMLAVSEG